MSSSAPLQQPTPWVNPLSKPEIIDLDGALLPHCPRTKRTIIDRDDEARRHHEHRQAKGRKELAMQRRGKPELSEAQNRALFSGHPSVTPEKFKGYKLTRRQRAQIKLLKKQPGGKPLELEHPTGKSKSRGTAVQHPRRQLVPTA